MTQSIQIGISAAVLSDQNRSNRLDGIGIYTKTLLEGLKKLSCEVIPVTYTPLFKKNKIKNPILPGGIAFTYPGYIEIIGSLFFPYREKMIENKISLYHSTDYSVPKLKKIPVVSTLHDALLLKHRCFDSPIKKIDCWLMKKQAQYAQRVIAISRAVVPELVEYWNIKPEKIDVVYNGIPEWWFKKASRIQKKIVLKNFQITANFLLFVSSLRARKNIKRIIQAYKNLPLELRQVYPLVVVGQHVGGLNCDWIVNELKILEQKKQGKWLDYVTVEELQILYQSATVFIFPSLAEGFGYPIVEAFASETPVITSNYGAMAEIAGDAAYLVDPYNVDHITDAIKTLLMNTNLSQQYVEKGKIRAHFFTAQKCIEQTLAVYRKLL
ncbi:MAG: hypothetical protein A3E82_06935 [Gammaproteobacteria bacterium RIFCSPHIGHO2_12_FULL_38_11]|nr:MAG: hypothetical protein A3E82_06935 [Gammaproteobacteria bacterium RIFCSPHIGHO2_12_FULL_38_11]